MNALVPQKLMAAFRAAVPFIGRREPQTDGTGLGKRLARIITPTERAPTERANGAKSREGSDQEAFALPVLSMADFQQLELPKRRTLLPWLVEGALVMIYGPRGVGKTFFSLSLAVALARAGNFIKWQVQEPVGVLVVDGEMPAAQLRERLKHLLADDPAAPLEILSHEIVFQCLERDLDLGQKRWQKAILAHLEKSPDIRVVIVDNLSCLLPQVPEDKRDEWVQTVLPFLIALRRRGIATILLHHAGKGGDQRGTSAREDALDTVIRLSELPDHDATEGAAFRVAFTKARGCYGDDLAEFEARLADDPDGPPVWEWKPVEESNKERLLALVRAGITSVTDAAEELELSKGAVSKLKKKLQTEGKLEPGRKLALAV